MRIRTFEITNFKGISHTKIALSEEAPGNVVTLIGLNESGKTTILEALSHFITEDKDTANLVHQVQQKAAIQDLIPKDKKAAFTGKISVEAEVELEPGDVEKLARFFMNLKGLVLDKTRQLQRFTVERVYSFEDSEHTDTSTLWDIQFHLKSKRAKNFKIYGGSKYPEEMRKVWDSGVSFVRASIPKIVYFPTFLFDFPDRIYLDGSKDRINAYYKQVIQDVLDSQGDHLDVDKHILERIKKKKEDHPVVDTFLSFFWGQDEKSQIDAVLQKASNEMSKVIFGSWNEILGRNITGKRLQIDWSLDSSKDNAPYLELTIIDGQSKFSLSEMSLGFRWFFSFLLFTQFRRNRKGNKSTVFLFDEPASNLHSGAQIKLLESFDKIAEGETFIVYSTHSHYMVNPLWLEKAYIIDNKAINYDDDSEVDAFVIRNTDIKAIKYRTFVGSHVTKTTYFQPVLDALRVRFSPLVRSSYALIIEGKNDFHPFLYLRQRVSETEGPEIFPGNGAEGLGCLISLFRGWGVRFLVLLDDDSAGRSAKDRYVEDLLLAPTEVATLGEINASLKGKAFEAIYQDDFRDAVKAEYSLQKPRKRHYSLYCQDLLAKAKSAEFHNTEERFRPISEWVDQLFQ